MLFSERWNKEFVCLFEIDQHDIIFAVLLFYSGISDKNNYLISNQFLIFKLSE